MVSRRSGLLDVVKCQLQLAAQLWAAEIGDCIVRVNLENYQPRPEGWMLHMAGKIVLHRMMNAAGPGWRPGWHSVLVGGKQAAASTLLL